MGNTELETMHNILTGDETQKIFVSQEIAAYLLFNEGLCAVRLAFGLGESFL